MPELLFQAALLIIIIRAVYMIFSLAQRPKKPWLDLLHYISVAIVALTFLL
ncbi:hypothetical protein [Paenibacillus mucilaginosus]|uniref:Uncharacterized protein n=3 Tax=Paenibacillus mucilaginosus TaxID=61624 RepID=H6NIR8_9BACL|nr:hypothetical protein [Paenibacillus mucilaginosus]AEI45423.1 hypothetical protein KNP414_06911 [Paenibacillus mucilaginosus KNP414]AFC33135.1 hypothetical protein PM3016_6510 [Paenibacillus mucilaginosus 3016]AFH65449.1 hypothetical protein B2K_32895 [Paenibacillus mucilaginosus K02]MCG7215187.1 hypothetical protein [Paenibacillus mucilaginosus]WDM26858.1 hypothetical protein KCX80_31355 [Paenibacillus mucilaginosus]